MSNSLFPHAAVNLAKNSFEFTAEEWPNRKIQKFFEELPERLIDSDQFEVSELATPESAELVIAAFHHAANEDAESGDLDEESYLAVVETTTVLSVVYLIGVSSAVVFLDFNGSSSDEDSSDDWE